MSFSINPMILTYLIALAAALLLGPLFIPYLTRLKFGQQIRGDGPARHLQKAGTPTMGGIIMLAAILPACLFGGAANRETLVILGAALGFGLIGFLDDFIKVALKRSLGLRAREKLLGQILLAAFFSALALTGLERGTALTVPFGALLTGGGLTFDWGPWFYLPFSVIFIVGMVNAVNLTDGLDGLAAGSTLAAALALAAAGFWLHQAGVSAAMLALAGACTGFLFYNRYPARVFMGDTGSLALGGALAVAAVVCGQELMLLIAGGVFVLETLSVLIQVFSFQLLGRRVFRMSPLHHHFELVGWSETRVVGSFWLLSVFFALLGVGSLLCGG